MMVTKNKTGKTGVETGAKATSAGRKARSSPSRAKPVEVAAVLSSQTPAVATAAPSERRAHLRAVEPVTDDDGADQSPNPSVKPTPFKRQDLIEAVCARSALKRSDAKVLVELALEELGRALSSHAELVLPPLGKLSVKRRKPEAGNPETLTIKLRRARDAGGEGDESPLAASREDG